MKKFISLLLIFSLFLLVGCVNHVEDTNGLNDYTIETYTDEDIASGKSKYLMTGAYQTTFANQSTLKVDILTGINKLKSIKAKNQDLSFDITSNCEAGNFRIVIVHNMAIVKDVQINSHQAFTLEDCDGTYNLIIVGESAKIDLEYSYTKGE